MYEQNPAGNGSRYLVEFLVCVCVCVFFFSPSTNRCSEVESHVSWSEQQMKRKTREGLWIDGITDGLMVL